MSNSPGKLRISTASRRSDEPWLEFLRSKSTIATAEQYDEMTDVWVVGNERGFRSFARALSRAETSSRTTVFQLAGASPHSMHVVIVPAEKRPLRAALRIWERAAFIKRQLQMELIIYGNVRAYRRVAQIAEGVSSMPPGFNHEHVDWDMDWVVQRSISLNFRAPFRTRQEMADQYGIISDRNQNPNFLPKGLEYLTPENHPYQTITLATARAHFPLSSRRIQSHS